MNSIKTLRVCLDIDDTILDWINSYNKYLNVEISTQPQRVITRNVYKLRKDKNFWENLPLLERPNFEPHLYCTKRINSKIYTRNSLIKNNLPVKPIYQMYTQSGNKADLIKGRCDVLIDDSFYNVDLAIKAGLPALLITRPHNAHIKFQYRVSKLDMEEIRLAYMKEINELGWNLEKYA